MKKFQAKLTQVIINGERHSVEDFVGMKPNERPLSFCPVCGERVFMHLGEQRVHHAKHKANSICPMTQPESALHFETKMYIADQLREGRVLAVLEECTQYREEIREYPGNNEFDRSMRASIKKRHARKRKIVIQDWDDVQAEYQINQYRPDIVLLKNGEIIGAVEVFVTHAIEPDKSQYLRTLSIPCIEVNARDLLGEDEKWVWNKDIEIPYTHNSMLGGSKYICSKCKKEKERQEKEKERLERESLKHHITTAVRIVDFYYEKGKSVRNIFYSVRNYMEEKLESIIIIDADGKTICSVNQISDFDSAKAMLFQKFEKYLQNNIPKNGCVDAHLRWQLREKSNKLERDELLEIRDKLPQRYKWDWKNKQWIQSLCFWKFDWNLYFTERDSFLQKITAIHYRRWLWGFKHPFTNEENSNLLSKIERKPRTHSLIRIDTDIYDTPLHPDDKRKKIEAVCVHCGKKTTDYWFLNGETRYCECNECKAKGIITITSLEKLRKNLIKKSKK